MRSPRNPVRFTPAEFVTAHSESTTLGVRQAKRPRAQVFSEDPILLPEIVDQIVLVTVHPASEREDEELQRRRHSLRLLGGLDQHRPSLGRPLFRTIRGEGHRTTAVEEGVWLPSAGSRGERLLQVQIDHRHWPSSAHARRAKGRGAARMQHPKSDRPLFRTIRGEGHRTTAVEEGVWLPSAGSRGERLLQVQIDHRHWPSSAHARRAKGRGAARMQHPKSETDLGGQVLGWYRRAKATKRGGMDGEESECLIVPPKRGN